MALTYEVAWNNEEDHNIVVEVHGKSQPAMWVSQKKSIGINVSVFDEPGIWWIGSDHCAAEDILANTSRSYGNL